MGANGDEGDVDLSKCCGVCYGFDDETGKLPEKVCDNSNCKQSFHIDCLVEWLQALPTTKRRFNMLFGECPYCNCNMNVKCMQLNQVITYV